MTSKPKSTVPFRFKRFTVRQDFAAMKVGFDGILLGAWADVTACRRILDVGTGTGLIALMLAQRTQRDAESEAPSIDAVELDTRAYVEAGANVRSSPWAKRIKVIRSSMQDFARSGCSRYQLIVSNPPYFAGGLPSPDRTRTLARQADTLTFEHLCRAATGILDVEGRLCVILPANRYEEVCDTARLFQLSCRRTTWVKPTPDKVAHRVLMEFRQQAGLCATDKLTVEKSRHAYSGAFRQLTRDFYLAF